ncbi:MAG: hypothetical protein CL694_01550 [Chloroflexi bacterium]|jgi:hypothetical protein|nr:hypothetical protein [Chloroflexota bacterium]HAL47552.1 hypothetical protein [Dehalococcoidia bacterium]|tara:strand:- start:1651 stop:1848 length:198 start_codon:yes stop_codon:yes gene_type:complete
MSSYSLRADRSREPGKIRARGDAKLVVSSAWPSKTTEPLDLPLVVCGKLIVRLRLHDSIVEEVEL